MTEKTQQKIVNDAKRHQKEVSDNEYKQRARFEALNTARYLNPLNQSSRIASQQKYDTIKEAEKIYQWLVKIIKP